MMAIQSLVGSLIVQLSRRMRIGVGSQRARPDLEFGPDHGPDQGHPPPELTSSPCYGIREPDL